MWIVAEGVDATSSALAAAEVPRIDVESVVGGAVLVSGLWPSDAVSARVDDDVDEDEVRGGDVVAEVAEISDVTDSRRDVVAEVANVGDGVLDVVDSAVLSVVVAGALV